MKWRNIKRQVRTIVLALLAALVVILISGIAVAESGNELRMIKIGTNVIIAAKQVMTYVEIITDKLVT